MNQLAVSTPCPYGKDTERRFDLPAYFYQKIENGLDITYSYYRVNENLEVDSITKADVFNEEKAIMETQCTKCSYNIASTPGMLRLFGGDEFQPLYQGDFEYMIKYLIP